MIHKLPAMTNWFVAFLCQCRSTPMQVLPCPTSANAASDQAQISFFPTLLGCLSPQWESLQAQYWLSNNSSCSPCLWAKQLSSQLLNITHGMWLFQNQQLQEYQQMSLTQQPPWSTKSLHLGSTISSLRISFTFSPPP